MSNISVSIDTTIPGLTVRNTDPSSISGLANGIPTSDAINNKGFFIPNWYVSDNQTGSSTGNRV
nr:hypothetical protein CQNTEFLM_CQNTEFLM_CDS_0003 [uncultured phage]